MVRNLEARLCGVEASAERFVVEQSDGEVRYDVQRLAKRVFAIRVRDAVLEIEVGVASVRIEGERVFVTVAEGAVHVLDETGRQLMVGGDMLRLPRLRPISPDGPARPPPLATGARLTRPRLVGGMSAGLPSEIVATDSNEATVRRARPRRPPPGRR